MKNNPWQILKADIQQGKNIELYITIVISFVVAGLSLIYEDARFIPPAILTVLSLVAFGLLSDRYSKEKEGKTLNKIEVFLEQQHLSHKSLFFSWQEQEPDLRSRIASASEVWGLTRSGETSRHYSVGNFLGWPKSFDQYILRNLAGSDQ